MNRPKLDTSLSAEDFLAFRWLKAELIVFCEAHAIPTDGNKHAIRKRVHAYLAGQNKIVLNSNQFKTLPDKFGS